MNSPTVFFSRDSNTPVNDGKYPAFNILNKVEYIVMITIIVLCELLKFPYFEVLFLGIQDSSNEQLSIGFTWNFLLDDFIVPIRTGS